MVAKNMKMKENEKIANEMDGEEEPFGRENPKIFVSFLWITNRKTGEVVIMESRDFFLSELKRKLCFNVSEELSYTIDDEWYLSDVDIYDIAHRYALIQQNDKYYIMKIINKTIIDGKIRKRTYTKKFKKELLDIFPDVIKL